MDKLINYSLSNNPIHSFNEWHRAALLVEQNADAMSVSTIDSNLNRPRSRYLLIKGIKDQKFVFYTNYLSPKSAELEGNNEIALAFYWHESKRQVRIHGRVEKMNFEESRAYFYSRDRESQLASYISNQSSIIADKEELLLKLEQATREFENSEVPMPKHWGGYLVTPYEFEFFIYGAYRLNDRFRYTLDQDVWNISRLQP